MSNESSDDGLRAEVGNLREEVSSLRAELAAGIESYRKLKAETDMCKGSFDGLHVIVVIVDPSGTILMVNRRARSVFGYRSPDEYVGKNWYDEFFSAQVRDEVRFFCGKLMAGDIDELKSFETPIRTRLGIHKLIAWHSILLKDASGKGTAIVSTGEDITGRKKLEEAVEQSQVGYRATLDILPDAIHIIDRSFRIVFMNKTFLKWGEELHLSKDALGRDLFQVFPFLPAAVRREYEDVFRTGELLVTRETTKVGDRSFTTETVKLPLVKDDSVEQIVTVVRELKM